MRLATALGGAALVGGLGLTISSAWLITMAAQHPPILVLSVSIVMVRFFGIFRSAARYGERIVSHETVFRNLTSLRVQLFEKISSRTSLIVRDLNSGNYVKAIVDDVERAQEFQLRVLLPRKSAVIAITFALLLALWIFPPLLLLLTPVSASLLIAIPSIVSKVCLEESSVIESLENELAGAISGAHYGATEARIYGYQEKILERVHRIENLLLSAERKLFSTIRKLQFITSLLIGTSIAGTALIMYNAQWEEQIPFVKISMAIFLPLVAFEGITNWYPNLFISGKLLRAQREVDSLVQGVDPRIENHLRRVLSADLVMSSATTSWGKEFMKPVNASVGRGELLVIRGKSGSGKSTLALALTGLLPYQGHISIGGVELREIDELYSSIAASLQRGHIFNTSLRENLKIANAGVDDAEMKRVLALLELNGIDLDEIVGEFGRALSGGEAKRVTVARALISNAPIILLDEPTEHLDRERAERLEVGIADYCRDKSLIVITHSGWLKSTRNVVIERE